MIKPALHHINLKTTRLQPMIDWYAAVTGMAVTHHAPVGAWLTNDAANHRIALLSVPGFVDDPDKEKHTGMHHMAFEYTSFAEHMESYERLVGLGITPATCLNHGMTVSMYYADPDKNFVELQSDNFGDWSKSKQWMNTAPEFAANPIGVFFDPVTVHAAWRVGKAPAELLAAIMAGAYMPTTIPSLGLPPPPPA
jgi:catechol 2,3-dioxygenase